jgi:hypothetical protein
VIDVVYVRHGADGRRLAALMRRGTGKDRGLVFVRTWAPREGKLRKERAIPREEQRGRPAKTDPQVAAIKQAWENERRGR